MAESQTLDRTADEDTPLALNDELVDQMALHWETTLRPRLEGLTTDEYLWEPAPGAWNLRRRGEAITSMAAGGGEMIMDFDMPEPDPSPVTTIAWRLGHLIVGVLGNRVANHFGGREAEYPTWDWAPTADEALAQLDEMYAAWIAGVRSLGEDRLADPIGPAEGPWAHRSYATLVLHIHREVIHHGAEICLLRDLCRATGADTKGAS